MTAKFPNSTTLPTGPMQDIFEGQQNIRNYKNAHEYIYSQMDTKSYNSSQNIDDTPIIIMSIYPYITNTLQFCTEVWILNHKLVIPHTISWHLKWHKSNKSVPISNQCYHTSIMGLIIAISKSSNKTLINLIPTYINIYSWSV